MTEDGLVHFLTKDPKPGRRLALCGSDSLHLQPDAELVTCPTCISLMSTSGTTKLLTKTEEIIARMKERKSAKKSDRADELEKRVDELERWRRSVEDTNDEAYGSDAYRKGS